MSQLIYNGFRRIRMSIPFRRMRKPLMCRAHSRGKYSRMITVFAILLTLFQQ